MQGPLAPMRQQQQQRSTARCRHAPAHAVGASQHLRSPSRTGSSHQGHLLPRPADILAGRRRGGMGGVTIARAAPTLQEVNKVAIGGVLPGDYDRMTPNFGTPRRAGIILHPTSLPGPYGIGEMGSEARRFVDWLGEAGMTVWQMLPLVPPDPMFYSPYSGTDANCGNPLVISLEDVVADGLLDRADLPAPVPVGKIDFEAVAAAKFPLLKKAAGRLLDDGKFAALRGEMDTFRKGHAWIEESALFDVLRGQPGLSALPWWLWPEELRLRKPDAIAQARKNFKREIDEFIAIQFIFERQWRAVRAYANGRGIKIVGDMPIYVGGNSADVWANQRLFELDPSGLPARVSGVPPDAFSAEGQLWGSPLYKWPAHHAEKYEWWVQRMGRALELYDETRIDHFRGFAGYWAVDGKAKTAMNGAWLRGPAEALFDALKAKLGKVPILAEDLGVITSDVVALRENIGAPGMVVLQFAWGGGPANVHLPHMHYPNCFVYPGTHDNETAVGWWKDSATPGDKEYLKAYLGTDGEDIAWDFIRACMHSVAGSCVVLLQDVMRLDNSARMNTPGRAENNWHWRMGGEEVWGQLAGYVQPLRALAHDTNRLPPPPPPPSAQK